MYIAAVATKNRRHFVNDRRTARKRLLVSCKHVALADKFTITYTADASP